MSLLSAMAAAAAVAPKDKKKDSKKSKDPPIVLVLSKLSSQHEAELMDLRENGPLCITYTVPLKGRMSS